MIAYLAIGLAVVSSPTAGPADDHAALSSPRWETASHDHRLDRLESRIMGATLRSDDDELSRAVADLESLLSGGLVPEESRPRAHLLAAFGRWQRVTLFYGNVEGRQEIMAGALAHVDAALAIDTTLARAHALKGVVMASSLPPDQAMEQTRAIFEAARRHGPGDPVVLFCEAMALAFVPGRGTGPFEDAVRAFEETPATGEPDWWRSAAYATLADAHLGTYAAFAHSSTGAAVPMDVEAARRALAMALALAPGFEFAHNVVRPLLETHLPMATGSLDHLSWQRLAEDPEGDVRYPDHPDAVEVSHARDEGTGLEWFRVQLAGTVPGESFGLNLALDVDGDPENGSGWWGSNNDFRYDRLVTVWLRATDGDEFEGLVGVGDGDGVRARRAVNVDREGIRFAVDPSRGRLFVGVPVEHLAIPGTSPQPTPRVLAAVGTARWWNDDLPDTGAIELSR